MTPPARDPRVIADAAKRSVRARVGPERRVATLPARSAGTFRAALVLSCALFVAGLASLALAAFTFPPLTGRVVDQADILPAPTRAAIEAKLAALEDKSGNELVVATVSSLQGSDIETYSVELARAWKIGEAKKNNGLVLLVAPNEKKVRIEVGYGLEGTMTDALSSVIIQSAIVPKFRNGDFAGGVSAGVDAIIDALTVDSGEWQAKAKVRVDQQPDLIDELLPFIIIALFLFVVISIIRNSGGGGPGSYVNRGGRTVFIPMNTGGWGGGFGGGSGGGFGGFSGGGGSFGGGGASGGW